VATVRNVDSSRYKCCVCVCVCVGMLKRSGLQVKDFFVYSVCSYM